jgi:hypothetical protein
MLAGIKALLGNPVLRTATLLITAVNTAGVGLDLVAVVILRGQAVSSVMIGVALAGGGRSVASPVPRWSDRCTGSGEASCCSRSVCCRFRYTSCSPWSTGPGG